jgi:hypothetical protein
VVEKWKKHPQRKQLQKKPCTSRTYRREKNDYGNKRTINRAIHKLVDGSLHILQYKISKIPKNSNLTKAQVKKWR